MFLDTRGCQLQMYKDIGWIPVKFFDSMIGKTNEYPQKIELDGDEYTLKDKYGFAPHYERMVK